MSTHYLLVTQSNPYSTQREHLTRWLWLAKLRAHLFVLLHPWGAAEVFQPKERA